MARRQTKPNPKVEQLYRYLVGYWTERRRIPSYREMADELSTSTSVVSFYLAKLEQDGKIERDAYIPRSITITGAVAVAPRGMQG